MNKTLMQRATPHVLSILFLFVVACLYCLPALKGLVPNQHDMQSVAGMNKQSLDFLEKNGHLPLWTNSMFSGMPAYQILIGGKYSFSLGWLHHLFTGFLPMPAGLFFLASLCFYILSQVLKIKPIIGVFGGIGYSYASYSAILMAVGHITKFATMGYAPAVFAGVILLTQKKYWLGFAVTLLFGTLMVSQNHVQVVYYMFIVLGCLGVAYTIYQWKQKQLKHVLYTGVLAALALGISLIAFAVILMPTTELTKETMRGGRSELTLGKKEDANRTKGGLDKDYAFNWSYGIGETMTVVLPEYRGGSSGMRRLGEENNTITAMQDAQLPGDAINYFYQFLSSYWGEQKMGTSGPVYLGALICLLFIAGLFVVNSWHKWWIIAATVIGLVLAWGSNFSAINYFLFDHLPFYNKFRAPSQAMIIPQFTFPLLAMMALQQIFFGSLSKEFLQKRLKYAGMAVAALVVLLGLNYMTASFKGPNDEQTKQGIAGAISQAMGQGGNAQQAQQQAATVSNAILKGLEKDRKDLYGGDYFRLIILLAIGALVIWLVYRGKLKAQHGMIALVVLNLFDQLSVDSRYLNKDNYVDKDEFLSVYTATPADLQIKQDTSYYRVFDQTVGSPFEDTRAAYHHNSIGGYNAAKLGLYQDLIQHQMAKGNARIFDMLNAKYIITAGPNNQPVAQLNPAAMGPAWLVKNIQYVKNADEEMKALDSLDVANVAVVDEREKSKIPFAPQADSTAGIRLITNKNDYASYTFNSAANQFAVFSEIYYPYGWKAFIDGKEAPIARVNYTLRAVAIPAGNHTIEMKFQPASYDKANLIGLITAIVSVVLILFCAYMAWRECKKNKPALAS